MINRELIRLKVVQLAYSQHKNPGRSLDKALEELALSLGKSYDLYRYLLLLIPEITDFARELYDSACSRISDMGGTDFPNPRFVANRLAAQLSANKSLNEFYDQKDIHHWDETEAEIRLLYKAITDSDLYRNYMLAEEDSYEADRSFWRQAYRKFICDNEDLDSYLEEWSLYWNDDKHVVDTFVLKTLGRFEEKNGAEQPLLPAYDKEEDFEFARNLFSEAILNRDYYENLIAANARNWEFERLGIMDVVIMVTALAEIKIFPEIKLGISINEYINIAKMYCPVKSAGFINGMLDNIANSMDIARK